MTAYNVVRFRTKPGKKDEFVESHRRAAFEAKGLQHARLVRTGDRAYCFIGEWDSFESIVAARPQTIALLDTFRDTLEDLGQGLGVTDPVSGDVVVELK